MPITLRASKNYIDPLAVLPIAALTRDPVEGPKGLYAEIAWSSYSPGYCVHINMSQFASNTFSQISSLSVDNSQCGCEVQFIFTDTNETVTFPAYSPKTICPVITNNREFYVQTVGTTLSTDITRFTVLNFVPPPVSVDVSSEQNAAAVSNIDMATASTVLVAATVNGTLENVQLNVAMNATNSGTGTWLLKDGAGNSIASGALAVSAGNKYNIELINLSDVRIRFSQGLVLALTETAVLGAIINANLYYRTP